MTLGDYLAVPVIPDPPDEDQEVPKEGHRPQDPDGDPEEVVGHQVLTGRELVRFR